MRGLLRAAACLLYLGMAAAGAGMPTLHQLAGDRVHQMLPWCDASGQPQSTMTGCADGSKFNFLVRKGTTNVNRVLIDFMGGGACWDERCLDNTWGRQKGSGEWEILINSTTAEAKAKTAAAGSNNIAFGTRVADVNTWTYVFVPYCTQDVHVGSCNMTYLDKSKNVSGTNPKTIHHNGAANVKSVMDWVFSNFPQPDSLAFIGCSAGATLAPFIEAGRASTFYGAGTTIVAVGDSPANLHTAKFARQGAGVNWGIDEVIAEATGWDNVTEHLDENLGPDTYSAIFAKHPHVQFGLYTRTADATQLMFYQMGGGMIPAVLNEMSSADALKFWNRQNLASLEALQSRHSNFRTFVAMGAGHCSNAFDSALTVTEPDFKAWLEALLLRGTSNVAGALINGTAPAAVNSCNDCTLAKIAGCDLVVGSKKLEDRCAVCNGSASCAVLSISARQCPVSSATANEIISGAEQTVVSPTTTPVPVAMSSGAVRMQPGKMRRDMLGLMLIVILMSLVIM